MLEHLIVYIMLTIDYIAYHITFDHILMALIICLILSITGVLIDERSRCKNSGFTNEHFDREP